MIDEGAVMAGEGSGSVAICEFQLAFDGFLAMGMILEMMARKKKPDRNSEIQIQILIVDDHPIVRQGLEELINHESDLAVC